jgi:hypothetical protein
MYVWLWTIVRLCFHERLGGKVSNSEHWIRDYEHWMTMNKCEHLWVTMNNYEWLWIDVNIYEHEWLWTLCKHEWLQVYWMIFVNGLWMWAKSDMWVKAKNDLWLSMMNDLKAKQIYEWRAICEWKICDWQTFKKNLCIFCEINSVHSVTNNLSSFVSPNQF